MEIRRYKEDDIEGIQSLFIVSFNENITKDWFKWKYEQSPWGAKGYVAVYDGKVVGFYGGLRMQFRYIGDILYAYQFCDVMTHPDYRGKVFSKNPIVAMLGEVFYKENEMDFAFGFPSLRHARLQALRLGGEGYRLIRQYKREQIKKRFSFFGLKIIEGWQQIEGLSFKEYIEESSKDTLKISKDKDYIHWRYVKHPLKKYNLLTFKRFGMLKGMIIFNVDGQDAKILEIIYDSERTLGDIFFAFENYIIKKYNCSSISLWCHQNDEASKIYEKIGYVASDHIPIAFKSVNKDCPVNASVFYNSFFYSMGDYDAG